MIKTRSYLSDGYASHYESSLLSLLSKTEKLTIIAFDTEGFDDQVIYNADIDVLQQNVIQFEISLLAEQRLKRVKSYLREKRYFISKLKRDALAFKTS